MREIQNMKSLKGPSPKILYYAALGLICAFLVFNEVTKGVKSWVGEILAWMVVLGAFLRVKLAVSLLRIPLYALLFGLTFVFLILVIPCFFYSQGYGDHTASNDAIYSALVAIPFKARLVLAGTCFVIYSLLFSRAVRRYLDGECG